MRQSNTIPSLRLAFLGALILATVYSCSFFIPSSDFEDFKDEDYKLQFNNSSWNEISPDKSDYAFANNKTGSILMLNSMCRKYQNSNVKTSAFNLLTGLNNLSIKSEKPITFRSYSGVDLEATGKLDGVEVIVKLLSFRRYRCTYDFVLISSNKIEFAQDDLRGFNAFKESIIFAGDE